MVENEWTNLPNRFTNIQLHEYIIMPNHFHAILQIVPVGATLVVARNDIARNDIARNKNTVNNNVTQNKNWINDKKGQPQGIAPTGKTVGHMMAAFKSITTVKYIHGVKTKKWQPFDKKLWHRNYWEHVIRNGHELNNIQKYIQNNPENWQNDTLNCDI